MNQHLKDHGNMSYNEHRLLAWQFSFQCLKAAFYAFCHGLIPNWYSGKINAAATIRKLILDYDD
jgi:hypothetical protein